MPSLNLLFYDDSHKLVLRKQGERRIELTTFYAPDDWGGM